MLDRSGERYTEMVRFGSPVEIGKLPSCLVLAVLTFELTFRDRTKEGHPGVLRHLCVSVPVDIQATRCYSVRHVSLGSHYAWIKHGALLEKGWQVAMPLKELMLKFLYFLY